MTWCQLPLFKLVLKHWWFLLGDVISLAINQRTLASKEGQKVMRH